MKLSSLALVCLAALTVGGLAWVFIYPLLSGGRQGEKRRASLARVEPVARGSDRSQRSRREQVEESLKDIEARSKQAQKISIAMRISQAGLAWSKQKFIIISSI